MRLDPNTLGIKIHPVGYPRNSSVTQVSQLNRKLAHTNAKVSILENKIAQLTKMYMEMHMNYLILEKKLNEAG